jgi:CRP-like cAMP-binding protein
MSAPRYARSPTPGAPSAAHTLRDTSLFSGASEDTLGRVARLARRRAYPAGQRIFRAGEPSDALLVVESGRVAVSSLSADGNELMLNIIDAVEVVGELGLLDGGPRSANVVALRDTRGFLLARDDLRPVLETEPHVAQAMLLLLCGRLRQTTSFLEDALLESVETRLLHRLQALARVYGRPDANGSSVRIDHGLSQQEIAESIGTSRVSVNKLLNSWRNRGLVELGRGFVVVHGMAGLEASLPSSMVARSARRGVQLGET